ncbi:hypothetical protein BCV70DRAFT_208895 [Testicularia cyperi]|uniref:Zinc-binding loop region of homing endonuclease domain-containing protein n=1 Tax=Testicularia cyperi TaxID=1882483 RepID=A0A317XIB9_9BASI|nr:hypothetical protein BCV70DRAFT_208895 [Testicularia cyperi]
MHLTYMATNTSSLTVEQLWECKQEKATPYAKLFTIMYLCGNRWCMNVDHYYIGSKQYNNKQTACHQGLQLVNTIMGYNAMHVLHRQFQSHPSPSSCPVLAGARHTPSGQSAAHAKTEFVLHSAGLTGEVLATDWVKRCMAKVEFQTRQSDWPSARVWPC